MADMKASIRKIVDIRRRDAQGDGTRRQSAHAARRRGRRD